MQAKVHLFLNTCNSMLISISIRVSMILTLYNDGDPYLTDGADEIRGQDLLIRCTQQPTSANAGLSRRSSLVVIEARRAVSIVCTCPTNSHEWGKTQGMQGVDDAGARRSRKRENKDEAGSGNR